MPIILKNVKPIFGGKVRVGTTTLAPRWLTEGQLTSVQELTPFSIQMTASHNRPYSFVVEGTLPTGVTFNAATATVSGIAPEVGNAGGSVKFAMRCVDSQGLFSVREFTLPVTNVNKNPNWVTTSNLGSVYGRNGVRYEIQLRAQDADGDVVRYELAEGRLPGGFAITTDGKLVGTVAGDLTDSITYAFKVRASDDFGGSNVASFVLEAVPSVLHVFDKAYTVRTLDVQNSAVLSQLTMTNLVESVPVGSIRNYVVTAPLVLTQQALEVLTMENLVTTNPTAGTRTYSATGLFADNAPALAVITMDNLVETDPAASTRTYTASTTRVDPQPVLVGLTVTSEIVQTPAAWNQVQSANASTDSFVVPATLELDNEISATPAAWDQTQTVTATTDSTTIPAALELDNEIAATPAAWDQPQTATVDTTNTAVPATALENV